jgi:glycosyltransferase involved in cell wall biosynthesis
MANFDFTNTLVSAKRSRFNYSRADLTVSPRVTVVTPFYNTGPIFHETAKSLLQQSFQEWEWLIINDGSTNPESLSMLEAYRRSDSRIRVIDHDRNQGPSTARNTGYNVAQAQYIVQLDSDNLLEPTAIEKWFWFLESYPEFSFCKGYSVGFGAEEYLWDRGFHNGRIFLDENQVDATSMVRKSVHVNAGGYDESIRDGLEDWDFWLRCASCGYWGNTVPEYLDWYRRRPTHTDRWKTWDSGDGEHAFHDQLRKRYAHLWNSGFPEIQPRWHMPNDTVSDELPCDNHLRKTKPRLLMILPWLAMGGADKFNLDLLDQLGRQGWEVTIATTLNSDDRWLAEFARFTPDIFLLHNFLRLVDYPRFLRYLIQSRQVDAVLISNSELGYMLLPYLRAHFPNVPFVDYCHIEEEQWKNGGYPRLAVEYQDQLDINVVSSEHLKRWMVERGADDSRIRVCYTNIDPDVCASHDPQPATIRRELGVKEDVPLILYAGRICLQKQPRVFAATMSRLCQQGVSFTALVAGDGEDLPWLTDYLAKSKMAEDVRLLGAVSIEQMQRLMAAADIFFLPSQWEGIALSIYEAMVSGLPVVGSDVGGQRELVTAECGVLIARSDEDTEAAQYAEVLAQLLGDPQRRAAMGLASRTRVSSYFHIGQMGKNMVEVLQHAITDHSNQGSSAPALGLARACAAQAVEYVRVFHLSETLWNQRKAPFSTGWRSDGLDWRVPVYRLLKSLYEPLYRRGVRRGGAWYFPLAETIKDTLLRPR